MITAESRGKVTTCPFFKLVHKDIAIWIHVNWVRYMNTLFLEWLTCVKLGYREGHCGYGGDSFGANVKLYLNGKDKRFDPSSLHSKHKMV